MAHCPFLCSKADQERVRSETPAFEGLGCLVSTELEGQRPQPACDTTACSRAKDCLLGYTTVRQHHPGPPTPTDRLPFSSLNLCRAGRGTITSTYDEAIDEEGAPFSGWGGVLEHSQAGGSLLERFVVSTGKQRTNAEQESEIQVWLQPRSRRVLVNRQPRPDVRHLVVEKGDEGLSESDNRAVALCLFHVLTMDCQNTTPATLAPTAISIKSMTHATIQKPN